MSPTTPPPGAADGGPDEGPGCVYRQVRSMRFTERAFEFVENGSLALKTARDGDIVLAVGVSGTCPRCLHPHTDTAHPTAVGVGDLRRLEQVQHRRPPIDFLVFRCKCEETHAGREEGQHGCGLEYRLDFSG